jgi:hypothetical protein
MQPHSLLGETPSQAVESLYEETQELPDDAVFQHKKEYIDTAQRYGMDDHVQALEDAYWDDITTLAREDYTADERAVERALYWHETRDLFDEHDIADLVHHNLDTRDAYSSLTDELEATGQIHTTDTDITYHFLDPDELHRRTHTDIDRDLVETELEDLQATLPINYVPD